MKKVYVYVITNKTNSKQCVGISIKPYKRFQDHLKGKGSLLVEKAFKKYGDCFHFIVIGYTSFKTACILEKALIKVLRIQTPNGYNITEGGEGVIGVPCSNETRKKLSKIQKGRPKSIAHRKAMSECRKERSLTAAHKRVISESHKKHPFSIIQRKAISEANYKPIIVNDIYYNSYMEAARNLHVSQQCFRGRVYRVKHGKKISCDWEFKFVETSNEGVTNLC